MPSRVSDVPTIWLPVATADIAGTSQYSDTVMTNSAHFAVTAAISRHVRCRCQRATAAIGMMPNSWNSGTTATFMPLIAKNASPNSAGHAQDDGRCRARR